MDDPIIIRPAVVTDLPFVDHLQRRNSVALAFYPTSALEREIACRRIVLAELGGEPAAYLFHGALNQTVPVHQACVAYDVRGQLVGSALVGHLVGLARAAGALSLTLRCGSDIEANAFWPKLGFYCEGVAQGGIRRRRDINCWRLDLQTPLFTLSAEPSQKPRDTKLYAALRPQGLSRFARGRAVVAARRLFDPEES